MKILVVDDKNNNLLAALKQLEEHDVTVENSYFTAMRIVRDGAKFDVAILDLLMPAEPDVLGSEGMVYLGEKIPAGYPLAIKLAMLGVPLITVATDTNHHNHPASAIMDWFDGETFRINGSKIVMMHAPRYDDNSKNWPRILAGLLES